MKDLVIKNSGGAAVASFRCEMLSNAPSNIEVLEIRNASGVQVDNLLIGTKLWQKLNYGWHELVAFFAALNYSITASDSNGSGSTVLLASV